MKKITVFVSFLLVVSLIAFNFAVYAEDKKTDKAEKQFVIDLKNAKCPVMGGDALEGLYTIHEGKMYHFCCNGCPAEFKKDPAKYIAKVVPVAEKDQAKIEVVGNKECPVTGEAVDKNITAVKDGKLYYFCCNDCVKKFSKDDFKTGKTEPCADCKTEKK